MKSKYNDNRKELNEDGLFHVIKNASEYDKSTFIGKFIFLWQLRFFFTNYNKPIKLKDVPRGRSIDGAEYVNNEFQKYWQAELKRAKKIGIRPNLIWPIVSQYGYSIIFFAMFCLFAHYAMLVQALYLDDLIRGYNELKEFKKNEYVKQEIFFTSAIMVALMVVYSNCSNIFYYFTSLIALRIRVCLSELIYRKALRLSKSAIGKTSTGQIVNFLSTDINRVDYFFAALPFPFVGSILLCYAIFKLWKYMAYFTIFGVVFLILVLPGQALIGRVFSKMQTKAADHTDKRLRLVDEFLNAIKICKFYGWEYQFADKINDARKKEIGFIKNSLYLYSTTIGLFTATTKIMVYIVLVTFYFSGGLISDKTVFLTFCVFNQVTYLITIFVPHFFLCASNFLISIRRINKFLTLQEKSEINGDKINSNLSETTHLDAINKTGNGISNDVDTIEEYKISVKNMIACYPVIEGVDNPNFLDEDRMINQDQNFLDVLKNIDFNCKSRELIIVVGPVGGGKSSLLQAILSELRIREGSIEVNGKLSYAGQEPWTFAGTIRENILFDSEFDKEKYDEVIKVCALERDLTLFQYGDQTFIGERGVALSGGQKARINLARSLYFDADIYLLDDPLSAVDAHVSKHIFKRAISEFLKNKTVVLVTHQLRYIKYADKVLFIKEGEQLLFDQGMAVMNKLASEPDSEFAKFVGDNTGAQTAQQSTLLITKSLLSKSPSLDSIEPVFGDKYEHDQLKELKKMENDQRLREEDDQVRFVYKAYLDYFKYGKLWFWGPILFVLFSLTQLFGTLSDLFLKKWADLIKVSDSNFTSSMFNKSSTIIEKGSIVGQETDDFIAQLITQWNVYLYTGLIVFFLSMSLIRTIICFVFSMEASVNIHNNLFRRIVRARMKFFYNIPVGIILNRFARDISVVDNELPFYFHDLVEIVIHDSVVFCVMAIANIHLIIPFVIFITAVIFYRTFYIKTGRTLETLEGVGKSPIIQHLSSTLNGLSTIRAFRTEKKFITKFERYQNDHTAIYFMVITCKRWFTYCLDNSQLIFVSGSLLVMVLYAESFSPSLVGLLVTYILWFSAEFQWCIICWSNLETYLCSVDRIERIGVDLDSDDKNNSLAEPPLESTIENRPPDDWPQRGVIRFRGVSMRYNENEDPILNNLNFTIESFQKIGVVGRTGAGKSSIVAALFRLTEYEGEIQIDGIDCKTIGLHDLRSRISIIPQEPVLFNGTVRNNLDPIAAFEDHKLWNALKVTQLDQVVRELECGLDSKVIDNGNNFSVGQKQLICLARAVLKENKILVLDEATANCDMNTDELIQKTIRTVFKDCTIITIAHRLKTIMDSTKVLVIDAGQVREFDSPYCLLQNEDSMFASMVNACGEEEAKALKKMARESEFRK